MVIIFLFIGSMSGNAFAQSHGQIEILAPWTQKSIKVSIINKANLPEDKISIIKKVIQSDSFYVENGQTHFEGWAGALQTLDSEKEFEVTVSEKTRGSDITIELLREADPRYNGYTVPHYAGNSMISASIQIYNSENISEAQLENLVRHEFGHALGFGHASERNFIMYESMGVDPKFITECELIGLKALNEGHTFRNVECSSA
ncbi:MAG: matrixin family metalloprotease [Thaumarchaeota archaeon]|nr:matrixin family metalloprotease [Nitrososphaerota archaeon]